MEIKCKACNGTGKAFEKCRWCFGTGRAICSSCGGSGGRTQYVSQFGKMTLTRMPCGRCGGGGRIMCGTCGGKGKKETKQGCPACHGSGKISLKI